MININLTNSKASVSSGKTPIELTSKECLSKTWMAARENKRCQKYYFFFIKLFQNYLPRMMSGLNSIRLNPKLSRIDANISLRTRSFLILWLSTDPSSSSHSFNGWGMKVVEILWTNKSIQLAFPYTSGLVHFFTTVCIMKFIIRATIKPIKYCSMLKSV